MLVDDVWFDALVSAYFILLLFDFVLTLLFG